jgi:hypothetical protein
MLQDRIRRHQRQVQIEAIIAAMPVYPIYHEVGSRYCIYVGGRRQVFGSEQAARLGQLAARASWLRTFGGGVSVASS